MADIVFTQVSIDNDREQQKVLHTNAGNTNWYFGEKFGNI